MLNNQFKNTRTLLTDLLGPLQKMGDPIDSYFDHVNEGEILNPFLRGERITMANNEALPPEFFKGFGIRTLILDTLHGRLSLSDKTFTDIVNNEAETFRWRSLKDDLILDDLSMLFNNTQIVKFDDWSDVQNASDLWDNLRRDVIMPLKRSDFNFIFYLGDTTKKLGFEVDEFLDIVCDFSVHGKVTLVLDEQNIDHLWAMFFSRNACSNISILPGLREKCGSVFDLINIENVIIESFPSTIMFSRQQQFEIEPRNSLGISTIDRKHFGAGYMLGSLLKMNISDSTVLGLAVSGVYAEKGFKPDRKMLLCYIENWMREKETYKPDERQLTVA
jgi:hypothetical protein